jgi:hypothetical protein
MRAAAACMNSSRANGVRVLHLQQADDPRTRRHHVLCRPREATPVEEHQCHTHRATYADVFRASPCLTCVLAKKEIAHCQGPQAIHQGRYGHSGCGRHQAVQARRTTTELRQRRTSQPQIIRGLHPADIHLERHGDQAHVLTLGQRSNRRSSRSSGPTTSQPSSLGRYATTIPSTA